MKILLKMQHAGDNSPELFRTMIIVLWRAEALSRTGQFYSAIIE